MATATATTIEDVFEFIHGQANETDLDNIFDAYRSRTKVLREKRALSVSPGKEVVVTGVSPKYLNGLRGTVEEVDGKCASVRLDEASTRRLRASGSRRFFIPDDETNYVLTGLPKSTCQTD